MDKISRAEADLISVIVPVYNVEKYLPTCIESIQRQSYPNLEIILVNDGSTDQSPTICDLYAQKDARIKVIHKTNGGLSDARNVGIYAATGKYLLLVDSDDYIGESCLQILHMAVCQSRAQIGICDYMYVEENATGTQQNSGYGISVYTNDECIKQTYASKIHGMEFIACGKLYERNLFLRNDVSYPVGKIHEDMFVTYKMMYYAERVAFVSSVQYYYRQRNGSIMHTEFSAKNLAGIEAQKDACDFFQKRGERDLYICAYNAYLRTCCQTLDRIQGLDDPESSRLWSRTVLEDFRRNLNCRDLMALGVVKTVFYTLVGIRPWKCLLKYVS